MEEAVESAYNELQYTLTKARTYGQEANHLPELLRSHISDITEDLTALTQLKSSWGNKSKDALALVSESKRLKRDLEKEAYRMEVAARDVNVVREKEDAERRLATAQAAQLAAETANQQPTTRASGVKLPRIKLPMFDGDSSDDYRGFKEAFLETIKGEPDLSDVRKWLLLRGQLSGKAYQMVKELPLAGESYTVGVDILDKAYGSTRKAVLQLYNRLLVLPNAEMDTDSLRMTHAKMEGILLSLKSLGKDLKEDFLRAVIISKYPTELRSTLRITDDTELDAFRTKISDYIQSTDCTIQQVVTVAYGTNGAETSTTNGGQTSSQGNGSKGHAKGAKNKPQHSNNAVLPPAGGGNAGGGFPPPQVKNNFNNTSASKTKPRLHKCIFCSGDHWSDECSTVATLDDRLAKVTDRCQKCLHVLHPNAECSNSRRWRGCAYCKELTHNRAICPKQFGNVEKTLLTEERVSNSYTKFVTATLPVGNAASSQRCTARAVLDTASSRSLITNDLAQKLGIASATNRRVKLTGVQGATVVEDAQVAKLRLFPANGEEICIEVFIVPNIVDNVAATSVSDVRKQYPECRELEMPPEGNGERIRILLGYSALTRIVTLQQSKQIGELQLMSTKFGWIPFGDIGEDQANENVDSPVCLVKEVDPIKLMCDLQQVGLADFLKSENEEEEVVLEKFYKTIERSGKQYQIEWPFRYDPPDLDDNFGLAMGRLQSLYKQLAPTPDLLKAYDQIIREQLETDVVEAVNTRKKLPRGRTHYLPHRGIVRFGKSTPIRMVFDASAKCRKGARSLNENIYKGGNWVTDIPGVLIRFRRYGTAVTSDIHRAFHQILIAPKDRDVTRFIWLRDTSKPPSPDNIVIYRFKRMAFGIVASPFLLTATIKYHLRENNSEYSEQIESDMYADNLVTSLQKSVEPAHFYRSVKSTFQEMGMNLTQWCTDDDSLRRTFQESDAITDQQQLVLGIPWNIQKRTLSIKQPQFNIKKENVVTKRIALQEMAKVYDPLGWALPVIVMARIFLRKIWFQKYSWDEALSKELTEAWLIIRANLAQVNEIQIPRAYGVSGIEANDQLQMHVFCDASAEAYGVVIYLLTKNRIRQRVDILASKAKLSPKTQLSIPRLELLAATIAAKYTIYVEKNLKAENSLQKFLWSDSRCVIAWLTSNKLLPPFIKKAVSIVKEANFAAISYVPTKENPADVVSRGADIRTLQQQNWWNGPSWLSNESSWPTQRHTCEENEVSDAIKDLESEEAKILLIQSSIELKRSVNPTGTEDSPFGLDPAAFRTLDTLFRRTNFCLKAATKFLKQRGVLRLSDESSYEQARILWLRWDQHRMYQPVKKEKSNVTYLQNLKVTEDKDGLIRCLTRTKWAKTPNAEDEPILLAKNTSLTKLIILTTHINIHHAGTAQTLAKIREEFWLPHGRRQCYKVIKSSCFKCRRHDAKPYKLPEMAQLPEIRIQPTETPFTNTGVDAFGPYEVKVEENGAPKTKKSWVLLFTCLVTRGVHLEILDDMRATDFLVAFRRFVGRRGTPRVVVTDNAPQFEVVDRIFQCQWRRFAQADENARYYAQHRILWKFIPEHSPWMGGAYERMVGTVKKSFEKVYGGKRLTQKQFELAMIEVEAIVNSRPISYVDRDNATEIITPNHFLCVRYPAMPLDMSKPLEEHDVAKAWLAGQQYLDEFWKLWSERYLKEIRERREKMKNPQQAANSSPKPGDLVLMIDPMAKRSGWLVASVERVIKSADGAIRAAQVRVPNRMRWIRPIQELAPLGLVMGLPKHLPEMTANHKYFVVSDEPGVVEL